MIAAASRLGPPGVRKKINLLLPRWRQRIKIHDLRKIFETEITSVQGAGPQELTFSKPRSSQK
jgi:hypothetical protein